MYNDSRVTQTIHRMTVKQRRYDDDSDDDDINVDDNEEHNDDDQRRIIHPALPLLARLGVRAAALRRINGVCRHLGVHHVMHNHQLYSLIIIHLSQSSRVDVAWHCCWPCLPTNVLIFTAKPNDCWHRCHVCTSNERCLNVQNKIYLLSVGRVLALFSAICCVENRVCVVCHVLPPTIVPTIIIIFRKKYKN